MYLGTLRHVDTQMRVIPRRVHNAAVGSRPALIVHLVESLPATSQHADGCDNPIELLGYPHRAVASKQQDREWITYAW